MIDGCPYCNKVMKKLDELDLDYELIRVPKSKSNRQNVIEISSQSSVPVITDSNKDIVGMNESDDIVTYLDEKYGTD